jgi:signal transduction histidine kinase
MQDCGLNIRPRILVIDDTEAIQADFRKILCPEQNTDALTQAEGAVLGTGTTDPTDGVLQFEVDCASQGAEGHALVIRAMQENRPYALAFVDIRMPPGWDGVETLTHIWETDACIQAVLCTAYSDYTLEHIVERLHPRDRLLILKKPFDSIEVRQLACALTAKWHLSRQATCTMRDLERLVAERTKELALQKDRVEESLHTLEQAHTQLLQSEKMASIGQLAAGVAHEINNPIGFISSNLNTLANYASTLDNVLSASNSLLQECLTTASGPVAKAEALQRLCKECDLPYVTSDLHKLVEESLEGAQRVRRIVADLRDFAHIDSPDVAEADINTLMDKTINVAWNELKYKAEVVREYGTIPAIPCYGGQLSQVFLNLLVNAAQAIEERGRITVRTGQRDSCVWVEVEDTGCGIPPENRDRVFEPFFTTKDVGEGTGMGLHLAYKIVEAHKGTISLTSTISRGTVFRVELPLTGPPDATERKANHATHTVTR